MHILYQSCLILFFDKFLRWFSFHIHFTHILFPHIINFQSLINVKSIFWFCFSIPNSSFFSSTRRFVIDVTKWQTEECVVTTLVKGCDLLKEACCRDIAGLYTGFVLFSLFCTYYMLLHVVSLCSFCSILMLRHLD